MAPPRRSRKKRPPGTSAWQLTSASLSLCLSLLRCTVWDPLFKDSKFRSFKTKTAFPTKQKKLYPKSIPGLCNTSLLVLTENTSSSIVTEKFFLTVEIFLEPVVYNLRPEIDQNNNSRHRGSEALPFCATAINSGPIFTQLLINQTFFSPGNLGTEPSDVISWGSDWLAHSCMKIRHTNCWLWCETGRLCHHCNHYSGI